MLLCTFKAIAEVADWNYIGYPTTRLLKKNPKTQHQNQKVLSSGRVVEKFYFQTQAWFLFSIYILGSMLSFTKFLLQTNQETSKDKLSQSVSFHLT